jgi:hypothetical protein
MRTTTAGRGRPRAAALPGMEDHAIKPLEDVATEYAEIRDARMELTDREHGAKVLALKLMKKYDKTIYRHNGVEITVVPGEDDVKVRVKKAGDDEAGAGDAAAGAQFGDVRQTDERRQAVDDEG